MKRDVLATAAQETTVTESGISTQSETNSNNYSSNSNYTHVSQPQSLTPKLGHLSDLVHQGTTGSSDPGSKFFNTYDPSVGINTATVLGGILLFLVLYVVYRTKCRKRILKTIQQCTMKYFPDEFPPSERGSFKKHRGRFNADESDWISESAKMIWQERTKLANDAEDLCCPQEDSKSFVKYDLMGKCEDCGQCNEDGEHIAIDIDCESEAMKLPDLEEDITLATAHWIQNVKDMDPKERQLNGLILKIPPDLVSHNAKVRSHFHSVTDYGEVDDFVNISSRNKSLPLLIEQKSVFYTYANDRKQKETNVSKQIINKNNYFCEYAPLATQDEFESDLDLRPQQLEVKNQTGSKVPLDICPIVRVQHFNSRSKRRHTSLCRTSSEETSTSGEDDVIPNNVSRLKTGLQAKYIRLQADTSPMDSYNPKIAFHASNNVTKHPNNCTQKVYPTNKLETGL